MESELKDLIEISQKYGKDKEYVIAGGGNTSFKNGEYLWIKASGIALSDIDENGFVKMSREKLSVISERTYSTDPDKREAEVKDDLAAAVISTDGKRPSVETSMHDVINYPFVIHTHPTVVNALGCSKKAKELTTKILGPDVLYIEYTDPGYVLFKKVADAIKAFYLKKGFDPEIILLENHGIFVSANTTKKVEELYSQIESKLLSYIGKQLPKDILQEFPVSEAKTLIPYYKDEVGSVIKGFSSTMIKDFVCSSDSFSAVKTAFTPDHIVYNKSRYLFLDHIDTDKIQEQLIVFTRQYGFLPRIIGIKDKGVIVFGDSEKSVSISIELMINMMKIAWLAQNLEGSKPMTSDQIAFIENWEVENYRKKMAK